MPIVTLVTFLVNIGLKVKHCFSSLDCRDDNLGIFRICSIHVATRYLKKGEAQPHGQTPPTNK